MRGVIAMLGIAALVAFPGDVVSGDVVSAGDTTLQELGMAIDLPSGWLVDARLVDEKPNSLGSGQSRYYQVDFVPPAYLLRERTATPFGMTVQDEGFAPLPLDRLAMAAGLVPDVVDKKQIVLGGIACHCFIHQSTKSGMAKQTWHYVCVENRRLYSIVVPVSQKEREDGSLSVESYIKSIRFLH